MKQTLLSEADAVDFESLDCNVSRSCSDSQIHEHYRINQNKNITQDSRDNNQLFNNHTCDSLQPSTIVYKQVSYPQISLGDQQTLTTSKNLLFKKNFNEFTPNILNKTAIEQTKNVEKVMMTMKEEECNNILNNNGDNDNNNNSNNHNNSNQCDNSDTLRYCERFNKNIYDSKQNIAGDNEKNSMISRQIANITNAIERKTNISSTPIRRALLPSSNDKIVKTIITTDNSQQAERTLSFNEQQKRLEEDSRNKSSQILRCSSVKKSGKYKLESNITFNNQVQIKEHLNDLTSSMSSNIFVLPSEFKQTNGDSIKNLNNLNQTNTKNEANGNISIFLGPPDDENSCRSMASRIDLNEYYYAKLSKSESFQNKISRVFKNSFNRKQLPISKIPVQQRFSILGRPLPASSRVPYFSEKVLVYNFLQRPRGYPSYLYHIFIGFMIISALIFFALTTVPSLKDRPIIILPYLDLAIFFLLLIEFIALCWSASCIVKYQNWIGKLNFLISPFRILDLVVIFSTAVVLWFHWFAENREQSIKYGWLRSLQIVQILRLENRFKAWRLLSSVIWLQRTHLLIVSYMAFLILIVISYVVYFLEQTDPNSPFKTIPTSLWWGLISIMTIGYGDVVPITTEGKIVGGILSVIGAITYALPAGIIATGLALKVQENNRQKHINKRTIPAAKLIQRAWRCYAASKDSRSEATWRRALDYLNKNSMRKKRQKKLSEWSLGDKNFDKNYTRQQNHGTARFYLIDENEENISQYSAQNSQSDLYRHSDFALSDSQKNSILFIRKLKFSLALKEFKNAFKPYDIQDVLQQYSEGHADVIGRVRFMQDRVNNIQASVASFNKMFISYNQAQEKRLNALEKRFDTLILLLENFNQKLPPISNVSQQTQDVERQQQQQPQSQQNLASASQTQQEDQFSQEQNRKSTPYSESSMTASDFYESFHLPERRQRYSDELSSDRSSLCSTFSQNDKRHRSYSR